MWQWEMIFVWNLINKWEILDNKLGPVGWQCFIARMVKLSKEGQADKWTFICSSIKWRGRSNTIEQVKATSSYTFK